MQVFKKKKQKGYFFKMRALVPGCLVIYIVNILLYMFFLKIGDAQLLAGSQAPPTGPAGRCTLLSQCQMI